MLLQIHTRTQSLTMMESDNFGKRKTEIFKTTALGVPYILISLGSLTISYQSSVLTVQGYYHSVSNEIGGLNETNNS